jgi:hypothetical protein
MRKWALVGLLGVVTAFACSDATDDPSDAAVGGEGAAGDDADDAGGRSTNNMAGSTSATDGGMGGFTDGMGGFTDGMGGFTDGMGGSGAGNYDTAGAPQRPSFNCLARGGECDTLDDCLVGQVCVEGQCADGGKAIGDTCSGEEYCGRDVRCVDGLCTYKYSIQGLCGPDPQNEFDPGPDPWLSCPLGNYCGYWGPFSSATGPTCSVHGEADRFCGTVQRCAIGYFCQASGGSFEEYPSYRCQQRIPEGPQGCFMDAPDECETGLVCNWVVSPEQLEQGQPSQGYGCVPPGKEGDYCNPWYPYTYYHAAGEFPSECGPNLFCSDEASPDAQGPLGPWDPHGRCVPLPEPTVPECEVDDECPTGDVCRDFYLGFKTCGSLRAEGATCRPGERHQCADGLTCLYDAEEFFAPHWGYCTRVAELGAGCDENTLCAGGDGACVEQ